MPIKDTISQTGQKERLQYNNFRVPLPHWEVQTPKSIELPCGVVEITLLHTQRTIWNRIEWCESKKTNIRSTQVCVA